MHEKIAVYRQNVIDAKSRRRFGDGCIGEIERKIGVSLARTENTSQRASVRYVQENTSPVHPTQEVEGGLVSHPPREKRAHLGEDRPRADELRARVRLEPTKNRLVPAVPSVEQGDQRSAVDDHSCRDGTR